jgi:hypothetical protein
MLSEPDSQDGSIFLLHSQDGSGLECSSAVAPGSLIRGRTLVGPLSYGGIGGSCPGLSSALGDRCDILRGWPDSGTCCLPRRIEGLDEVPRREAAPVSAAANGGGHVGRLSVFVRLMAADHPPRKVERLLEKAHRRVACRWSVAIPDSKNMNACASSGSNAPAPSALPAPRHSEAAVPTPTTRVAVSSRIRF